jgi:hypothetical protein
VAKRPRWLKQVFEVLETCVEGYGPGSFDARICPDECHVTVAPVLAEIVGGAEDGEEVYPLFAVHLAELANAFDKPPETTWDTMHDELHVEGEIQGEDVWITFQKSPFRDDDEPQWVIERGSLRRRKPSM